jgi:predicted CopG family antitoxin
MDRITIGISKEVWKKLMQLKIDKTFRTFDEVLSYLLNKK